MKRLPLQVEELRQILLALIGLLDLLGKFPLRGFDDFLLLADLFGLLFQGVLALVEETFAFVELAADFAQLFFAFVLLLEQQLLDLQFTLAAAVLRILLGLGDDFRRLPLGVLPPQFVENLDQHEGHHERHDSRSDDGDDLSRGEHVRYLAIPKPKALGKPFREVIAGRCGRRSGGPTHHTDRRLEIGGVCGDRKVGRVTQRTRGWGREAPQAPGARQEAVVIDENRRGTKPSGEHPSPLPTTTGPASTMSVRAMPGPAKALAVPAHPCPRQYVIQPMLRRSGSSRGRHVGHRVGCHVGHRVLVVVVGDPRSNRRQPRRAAALAAPTVPATKVHPLSRTRTARFGIAINH